MKIIFMALESFETVLKAFLEGDCTNPVFLIANL